MTISINFSGKLILPLINKENSSESVQIQQRLESLSKHYREVNNDVVNRKTQLKHDHTIKFVN